MDALIPVEVGLESYRTEVFDMETKKFELRENLDLLEEEREAIHQRKVKYQLQAAQYYDSGVKKRSLYIGNLA